jgi:hypothetical protein
MIIRARIYRGSRRKVSAVQVDVAVRVDVAIRVGVG